MQYVYGVVRYYCRTILGMHFGDTRSQHERAVSVYFLGGSEQCLRIEKGYIPVLAINNRISLSYLSDAALVMLRELAEICVGFREPFQGVGLVRGQEKEVKKDKRK